MQDEEPVEALMVPAGHERQKEELFAAVALLNVPAGQLLQLLKDLAPGTALKVPRSHGSQEVAPRDAL